RASERKEHPGEAEADAAQRERRGERVAQALGELVHHADAEEIRGVREQRLDEHPVLVEELADHACSAISTTFEPPKANELDITARGGAMFSARSATWRSWIAGSGCSRNAVGATRPCSRAMTATASSRAPAPHSRAP